MTSSVVFGDFARIESGYAFKSADWLTNGFPVVKIKNIKDGFVTLEDCAFVSEDVAKRASAFKAQSGDILISLTGYVGQVGRVLPSDEVLVNQRVGFIRPENPAEADYIYYLLRYLRPQIEELGTGTAQSNVAPRDILNLSIPDIPKDSRGWMGSVLSNLDKKIASNYALSKTLEDIAQTIFKSWFIDFDIVKAKMAKEKPEGMDALTAALFPDSMDESEIGFIPRGWQVRHLGDLVTPKKGKTITKATCVDGEVPVVAGGLQPAYFHNTANALHPVITVSASGANAGYVRLYLKDVWASDCSYINSEITKTVHFWYLFLSRNQERIYGMQQGAAQPHIYPSDLMRLKLSIPNSIDLVMKFEETVKPLFLEIGALERQSESLRSLRDSLLPRLISGELQIPEEMLAS
jgi:type I restriction enzyme S subunit